MKAIKRRPDGYAMDDHTGQMLASVMGNRADEVFLVLQALLKPFGITRYYADKWGAYRRYLPPEQSLQSLQLFGQEVIPAFP